MGMNKDNLCIVIELSTSFLHVVVLEEEAVQHFSVPVTTSLEESVREAIKKAVEWDTPFSLILLPHRTTLARLTRRNKPLALLLTKGFEDSYEIALNHLHTASPQLASARDQITVIPVEERTNADGSIDTRPDEEDLSLILAELQQKSIRHVAVCLLHSRSNPLNETFIGDYLSRQGMTVMLSCEQSPWLDELPRAVATLDAAFLAANTIRHLTGLAAEMKPRTLEIATRTGSRMPAAFIENHPGEALAGPHHFAADFAWRMGRELGIEKLITFDMGVGHNQLGIKRDRFKAARTGTLIDHEMTLLTKGRFKGGTTGGHAWLAEGKTGLLDLRYNPEANIRPACYGDHDRATLTDALLYLGILPADELVDGHVKPDLQHCNRIIEQQAQRFNENPLHFAENLLEIARAVLEVDAAALAPESTDNRHTFTLCSYGAYAGMFCCDLANNLGIRTILVPQHAGVMASLGARFASPGLTLAQRLDRAEAEIWSEGTDSAFQSLIDRAVTQLSLQGLREDDIFTERSVVLRPEGSRHAVAVAYKENLIDLFHHAWEMSFNARPGAAKIISDGICINARAVRPDINLKIVEKSERPAPGREFGYIHNGQQRTAFMYRREELHHGMRFSGPAVVLARDHYTFVADQWHCSVDQYNNLRLSRDQV